MLVCTWVHITCTFTLCRQSCTSCDSWPPPCEADQIKEFKLLPYGAAPQRYRSLWCGTIFYIAPHCIHLWCYHYILYKISLSQFWNWRIAANHQVVAPRGNIKYGCVRWIHMIHPRSELSECLRFNNYNRDVHLTPSLHTAEMKRETYESLESSQHCEFWPAFLTFDEKSFRRVSSISTPQRQKFSEDSAVFRTAFPQGCGGSILSQPLWYLAEVQVSSLKMPEHKDRVQNCILYHVTPKLDSRTATSRPVALSCLLLDIF